MSVFKSQNKYKRLWILVLIFIPVVVYFLNFSNGVSDKSSDWGNFGSYIGGVYSVIIAFSIFYITRFIEMKDKDKEEKKAIIYGIEGIGSILLNIVDMVSKIENEPGLARKQILINDISLEIDKIRGLIERSKKYIRYEVMAKKGESLLRTFHEEVKGGNVRLNSVNNIYAILVDIRNEILDINSNSVIYFK